MCDPVSMLIGAVGGAALGRKKSSAPAAAVVDPATEQADAEAKAAQAANMKLAADQQRRRAQQSLLATGADAAGPTFGAVGRKRTGLMTPVTSSSSSRGPSLMARGAGSAVSGGGSTSAGTTAQMIQ